MRFGRKAANLVMAVTAGSQHKILFEVRTWPSAPRDDFVSVLGHASATVVPLNRTRFPVDNSGEDCLSCRSFVCSLLTDLAKGFGAVLPGTVDFEVTPHLHFLRSRASLPNPWQESRSSP